MKRAKCEKCGRGYKSLTKEGLCASCHKDKYGEWSKEFQEMQKSK